MKSTNDGGPLTPLPPFPATYRGEGDSWIERSAKLFEAGEFPDKGVTITVEDLNGLAGAFGEPVPVLIEHAESPLELGYLTSVQVMGDELFGTVSLTPEAHGLVERSGARSLSLGLTPDLMGIREVSLVRHPRVESARLFSAGPVFWGELGETCVLEGEALAEVAGKVFGKEESEISNLKSEISDPPLPPAPSLPSGRDSEAFAGMNHAENGEGEPEPLTPRPPLPAIHPYKGGEGAPDSWRQRYDRLVSEQREKEADRRLREFVAQGRLTPAQVPFARALLLASDTVAFDGSGLPVGRLVEEMIARQPPLPLFGEQAPDLRADYSSQLLLPEEAAFYRQHFPDVSLEEIARARK